jgi:hypothetical protein
VEPREIQSTSHLDQRKMMSGATTQLKQKPKSAYRFRKPAKLGQPLLAQQVDTSLSSHIASTHRMDNQNLSRSFTGNLNETSFDQFPNTNSTQKMSFPPAMSVTLRTAKTIMAAEKPRQSMQDLIDYQTSNFLMNASVTCRSRQGTNLNDTSFRNFT